MPRRDYGILEGLKMESKGFSINIGSDIGYLCLLADIFYESEHIVRVSQEEGMDKLHITIYPSAKQILDLKFEDFENVLLDAKQRLLKLNRI